MIRNSIATFLMLYLYFMTVVSLPHHAVSYYCRQWQTHFIGMCDTFLCHSLFILSLSIVRFLSELISVTTEHGSSESQYVHV